MADAVDEAEGPRVQVINSDQVKFLYTSLFGFNFPIDLIAFLFAIFLIIFGFIGYFSSGSLISLIASIGISLPILIGSYLTTKHIYWSFLTWVATLFLLSMMSFRFFKSAKFYPSGLVTIISFVFLSFLTTRLIIFYKNH